MVARSSGQAESGFFVLACVVAVMVLCLTGCLRKTTPISAVPSQSTDQADLGGDGLGKGDADVVHVRAVWEAGTSGDWGASDSWTFRVTVEHPDTGWDDSADGWDVVTPDGGVLKPDPGAPFTRLLLHPHVDEQPFTRSQSNIEIPPDVTQVRVRAHDLVDGYGGREVVIDLTKSSGPGYEVERRDS